MIKENKTMIKTGKTMMRNRTSKRPLCRALYCTTDEISREKLINMARWGYKHCNHFYYETKGEFLYDFNDKYHSDIKVEEI